MFAQLQRNYFLKNIDTFKFIHNICKGHNKEKSCILKIISHIISTWSIMSNLGLVIPFLEVQISEVL